MVHKLLGSTVTIDISKEISTQLEVFYMEAYWWFLIPVVCLTAFSGTMDATFQTDGKLKKVILVFSVGVVFIHGVAIPVSLFGK